MTLVATRPGPGRRPPVHASRPSSAPRVGGGVVVAAHMPGQLLATAVAAARRRRRPARRRPRGHRDRPGQGARGGHARPRLGAAFALALERLGAELSTSVDWDAFRAGVSVPVDLLPAAVALLAEAARTPKLDPADVARVRDDEVTALRMDWAQPGPRADAALRADLFGAAERYGRPLHGDPASVAAVTVDDVHRRSTVPGSLRPGVLLVAGDLDRLDLDALGAAAFAGTSGDPLTADGPLGVPLRDRPPDRSWWTGPARCSPRCGSGTGRPHRAHPDYVPMSLAATVLGGAFTSRLNHLIREVKGYTYGIRGDFAMSRRFGRFGVSSAVQTAVTAPALADTIGEIARTRLDGVTEDELDGGPSLAGRSTVGRHADAGLDRRRAGHAGGPRPAGRLLRDAAAAAAGRHRRARFPRPPRRTCTRRASPWSSRATPRSSATNWRPRTSARSSTPTSDASQGRPSRARVGRPSCEAFLVLGIATARQTRFNTSALSESALTRSGEPHASDLLGHVRARLPAASAGAARRGAAATVAAPLPPADPASASSDAPRHLVDPSLTNPVRRATATSTPCRTRT